MFTRRMNKAKNKIKILSRRCTTVTPGRHLCVFSVEVVELHLLLSDGLHILIDLSCQLTHLAGGEHLDLILHMVEVDLSAKEVLPRGELFVRARAITDIGLECLEEG